MFGNAQISGLARVFADACALRRSFVRNARRGGKKSGSAGGRKHTMRGNLKEVDMDADEERRLLKKPLRRKPLAKMADIVAPQTPICAWVRAVTDYGKTVIINPDQFDAMSGGGFRDVVPLFR